MHPNPTFRKTETKRALGFVRARGFGALAVNADPSPLLAHIPFWVSDDGTSAEAHLVRSNPILRLLDQPQSAVLSVQGPDAYISPDWYDAPDQVPTWNYVAVHLRGRLHRSPDEALFGVLDRLSAEMERRLLPKPPWKMDKLTEETYAKMARQIVPVHFEVQEVDSTFKLSQNKSHPDRNGAIAGLENTPIGSEIAALADLMKQL